MTPIFLCPRRIGKFVFLVKLVHQVQKTRSAFEDSHRSAVVFDVYNGWKTSIWVNRSIPILLWFARSHIHINIVVRDAGACEPLFNEHKRRTYPSSSAAIVSL